MTPTISDPYQANSGHVTLSEPDTVLDGDASMSDAASEASTERPFYTQHTFTVDDVQLPGGTGSSSKNLGGLGRLRGAISRQESRDDQLLNPANSLTMHANVSATHLEDLEAFPTTSLHSFSFAAQHDTIAARHNIVQRSIDYLRGRLSGADRAASSQEISSIKKQSGKPSGPDTAPTKIKNALKIDLQGVNDRIFDPTRQPPLTAPFPQPAVTKSGGTVFIAGSSNESSRQNSGTTSPQSASRSTTMTSGTSVQSWAQPVSRGRAISFSDKYPDLRRQLQSSLSCTNLPNLNSYYQSSPLQTLHSTNRWGQQTTQAVFTTSLDEPWSIQSANDYATMIFAMGRDAIRDKSLIEYIAEDRRDWLRERLSVYRKNRPAEGQVLLCGDVLPVIKRLGTGAASLWVKQKTNGLVWVIEEIEEGVCILSLDAQDRTITAAHGEAVKILERSLVGIPLDSILGTIPRGLDGRLNLDEINRIANYTIIASGGDIPCTLEASIFSKEDKHSLRVSFLPHVAGILVLSADDLTIKSANPVFTSSLLGQRDVAGSRITDLIPDFKALLSYLEQQNGQPFREGQIVPELAFRDAAKYLQHAGADTVLRGIKSRHRDGATVFVDIQMRIASRHAPLESTLPITTDTTPKCDQLYALWISYEKGLTPKAQDEVVYTALSQAKNVVAPKSNTSTQPPSPVELDVEETALEQVPRSIKDYHILEEMGAGAYGQVKLARHGRKRHKVVLKYVTKSRILVDTWTRDRKLGTVPLEIHVLNHLKAYQHRNLVEMQDFFEDDQNYYIVMSAHIPGMDLFDYIELNTSMSEWECKCISLQVAKALSHLHTLDIVHRDIKDENVVIDRSGWVKLIDFGSANYCRNGPFDTFHGTLDYASPEALDGKPYMGKEQDVWACGILFYTLIYKENPFYNIDEIMDRDLRVPYILSEKSIDLVKKMLIRNVPDRWTMEQILQHEWYADCAGDPQERVKIDIPQR